MALPTAPDREAADLPRESTSLLYGDRTGQATAAGQGDLTFASDLRLDQAVGAIAGDREERELVTGLLYQQVRDIDTLLYRHEIFRDLQDPGLFGRARHFAEQMRQVRASGPAGQDDVPASAGGLVPRRRGYLLRRCPVAGR
jgi:hypothetical protein